MKRAIELDLHLARALLMEKGATIVVVKNGRVLYIGYDHGLRDLYMIVRNKEVSLPGSSVADKVIGKAAAVILLSHAVKGVYATILSKSALELLKRRILKLEYEKLVPAIRGRNEDLCPFEKLVLKIDDVKEAYRVLMRALKRTFISP